MFIYIGTTQSLRVSQEKPKVKLYLTVGIPGAGKTTWVQEKLSHSCEVVALDKIRKGIYGFFPQKLNDDLEKIVWERALILAKTFLESRDDTVIDSMALTKFFRNKIISTIKAQCKIEFDLIAIFFDTPIDLAIERNSKREKYVNESTIRMLQTYLEKPLKEEGFKEVIYIKP